MGRPKLLELSNIGHHSVSQSIMNYVGPCRFNALYSGLILLMKPLHDESEMFHLGCVTVFVR
jgi:hypothetical protein